ncbi:MAG: DUF1929 domain-containing protein [Candidatus Eremiobacteraeota bacterium]|nr:DUF1929 domain-containing protein [Candidatus Eremiobacteraeota bacterium]
MKSIDEKYTETGGASGPLGKPIAPEGAVHGGRARRYAHGAIYSSPSTGPHVVLRQVHAFWAQQGAETSRFGFPASDTQNTKVRPGIFNAFQHGSVYWSKDLDTAYFVSPPARPLAGEPAEIGRWDRQSFANIVVGAHAALCSQNDVLFLSYRDPGPTVKPFPRDHGDASVLSLAEGTAKKAVLATDEPNFFCAGHAFTAQGTLVVCGGDLRSTAITMFQEFDPATHQFSIRATMNAGRWYPSCATLPDGTIFAVAGHSGVVQSNDPMVNATYEVFDPVPATTRSRGPVPLLLAAGDYVTYPFVFVLPSKRLLLHCGTQSALLNINAEPFRFEEGLIEAAQRPNRVGRTYGTQGSAVMLPLDPNSVPPYQARILAAGGSGSDAAPVKAGPAAREHIRAFAEAAVGKRPTINTPATNTCEIFTDGASPAWRLTTPLKNPRVMGDAVLLPDGTVFVTNGSFTGLADAASNPVLEAEIFDPDAETWTPVASMSIPRLYHSTALLVPDGRVLVAGSDSMWNPEPFHVAQLDVEFYSPPYMFRDRPEISDAPASLKFGTAFQVVTNRVVKRVALLRCGAVTHSFNAQQRYVNLNFHRVAATTISVEAPPNGYVAPPGPYLLYVLDERKTPSIGRRLIVGAA